MTTTKVGKGRWRLTYNSKGECVAIELWDDNETTDTWDYEAMSITLTSKGTFKK